ncbi:MAG: DUF2256 domain-containing protein [Pseudomonadales bacterium]
MTDVAHKKPHLPAKQCAVCGLTFYWRKKWARDWAQVKYCSERCRRTPAESRAPQPSST